MKKNRTDAYGLTMSYFKGKLWLVSCVDTTRPWNQYEDDFMFDECRFEEKHKVEITGSNRFCSYNVFLSDKKLNKENLIFTSRRNNLLKDKFGRVFKFAYHA